MDLSKAVEIVLRTRQFSSTAVRPASRILTSSSKAHLSRRQFSLYTARKAAQAAAAKPLTRDTPPISHPNPFNPSENSSSADDLRNAFNSFKISRVSQSTQGQQPPFGAPRPAGRIFHFGNVQQPPADTQAAEMDRMFPTSNAIPKLPPSPNTGLAFGFGNYSPTNSNKSVSEQWLEDIRALNTNLHLSSKTGRTMAVNPASPQDLSSKLKRLHRLCSEARIPAQAFQQRFHERGGLRRKRLKSQRWRARFLVAFRSVVHRVRNLAKKGW